ncbi:MAG: PBSX family phage terminase large subunit [Thermoanaerobacteraceae bacterium]|nr:PBSX family phage terminase large subunit [Thermoanaerobacteraceae bacterium]
MAFKWGLFSPKQLASIEQSDARLNIWEGSVRSGKTISSIVRWLEYIKTGPPGDLLMVGKTERTLKRNILDPIEQIVGTKRFKYNRGLGEVYICGRRIYVVGANDERAEGKIRGHTLAGAYGDELTLWPESFFKMLLSRLSISGAKFFGTTNPDSPYHWLKTEYLDKEGLNLKSWHFTLEDNPNLDPAYVEALKKEYVGLWYKRFILGLWVLAEGAVYDMWDDQVHAVDRVPVRFDRYYLGVDYGTNNPTVFLLIGQAGQLLYVLDEYYWDSSKTGRQKTDAEYSRDLQQFIGNRRLQAIIIDPSAASFITQLRRDGVGPIREADNSVLDGIRNVASFLSGKRLFVYRKKCPNLLKEFSSYVWDPKAQQRGEDKPLKQNDHALDALRYVVQTAMKYNFDTKAVDLLRGGRVYG